MTKAHSLAFAVLALCASTAAQNCSDNTYPVRLVDATGALLPTSGSGSSLEYLAAHERVYMALDPALPSGLYYVHVTDPIGGHDEVVSLNEPADRFVQVTNNAGVIALSLPYSVNPDVPPFGLGLGGVGQSVPLFPLLYASWDPCHFKAWLGDSWAEPLVPTNPYLVRSGYDAGRGACRVRSYLSFRIGDSTGTDVTGFVFEDLDRDGQRDGGEPGLAGQEVRLVSGASVLATTTDAQGDYRFADVPCGSYSVEITIASGSIATTSTSHGIEVCGCADVSVPGFGRAEESHRCDGHTIGFWRNKHGLALIAAHNLLPQLNALGLVGANGQRVTFATLSQYAAWLRGANAVNMAYMLSAQATAMYCNVAVGFVDDHCRVDDALGVVSIDDLLREAFASLALHPFTPVGHAARPYQTQLKDAIDGANNNSNWLGL